MDRQYKRRSIAWDHFVKKDAENYLAECNYCREILCYASTSANLVKHLESKHKLKKKEQSFDKEKLLESEYWEYFDRDADSKLATCKLCSEDVDYEESPTAPYDHIKKKHISEINEVTTVMAEEDSSGEDESDEVDEKLNAPKSRAKTSLAWNYFDIEDEENKLAVCKLCGDIRSYFSTVTNLIRHINKKHANYESAIDIKKEFSGNETTVETDAEENVADKSTRRKRSSIWLYFKNVDSKAKKARCLICKKILSHSTTVTNLKQHIRRKHPHLKIDETKTILLSEGGELFEVETNKNGDFNDEQHEPEEMDTVYLEDFDSLENPPNKKKKYTKPQSRQQKPRLTTINLHDSSSDDDELIQSFRRSRNSDSTDHFAKYAVSLLRELPKEISNKLQSDFISRIMDAQLTYESQKLAHAQAQAEGHNNAYSITVTTVDGTRVQEPEENVVTEVVQSETQTQEFS